MLADRGPHLDEQVDEPSQRLGVEAADTRESDAQGKENAREMG